MYFSRKNIIGKLVDWKNSSYRKPLLLKGARQVGKTWLIKNFGENNFKSTAYFNFDEQPDLKQFFEQTKDVKRILQNLSLVHGCFRNNFRFNRFLEIKLLPSKIKWPII